MNAASARVRAQAKVNLTLRILAREASGYHQLETLFCRLDLGDVVTVRPTGGSWSLDCDGPAMPAGGIGPVERNLAWRAATAFADATGWPSGVAIEIEKQVPVGGGLGGGSADAGAVLRALNALCPTPLAPARLLEIAGTLGADVPFVTQAESPLALAWGRGDRMLALPALPARGCLVVTAPFGVNTASAFGWLAEHGLPRPAALETSPDALSRWGDVDALSRNDFEAVVMPRHQDLARAFAVLQAAIAGRGVARMSGSGSTLYALVPPQEAGTVAARLALPPGFEVRVTGTATGVAPVEVAR